VDNSGSMREEQAALTLRFPELIQELVNPGDDDGDTRIDHPPVEEEEEIEVVSWPLSDLGGLIQQTEDAKSLIGLLRLAREIGA